MTRASALRRSAHVLLVLALLTGLSLGSPVSRAEEDPAERAEHLARIVGLQAQVDQLYHAGDVRKAVALGRELLTLCETKDGPEAPTTAAALSTLCAVSGAAGLAKEACAYGERSLALNEKLHGAFHVETATALDNLGEAQRKAGDLKAARATHERALAIREELLGPKHPTTALSLNNLGLTLKQLGEYETARPLYERALAIREEVLGPDHLDTGLSLNNLSFLLHALGELDEARPLGERYLKIYEKQLGPMHPRLAMALGNMGSLLVALGDHRGAHPYYQRALRIHEATLGPTHPTTIISLNNVASIMEMLGQEEEALGHYERVLTVRAETLGGRHPGTAQARQSLGTLLWKMGRADKARPLLERAIADFRTALGPEHPATTVTMNTLGLVLAELGELEPAEDYLRESLQALENALGPDHLDTAINRTNLASLAVHLGRYEEARDALLQSVEGTERVVRRNVPGLDASARLTFASHVRWHLHRWAYNSRHWPDTSYEPVLRAKGLVARIERAERRVARAAPPSLAPRFAQLEKLDRHLARLSNQIPFRRTDREKWQKQYAEIAAEREALDVGLAREVAAYREEHERLALGLEDVRASLSQGAVLVDMLRIGRHAPEYVAWVVRPDGAPVRVPLGLASPLDAAVTDLLEALQVYRRPAEGSEPAWRAPAKVLADGVLQPLLAAAGDDVHTIYVCPDAALSAVPFAALPHAAGTLLDAARIVHLPFATDLVPPTATSGSERGALALGDVDYAKATPVTADEDAKDTPIVAAKTVALRAAPRGGRSFVPLPASRAEIAALKERLGDSAVLLHGSAATEAALRRTAPGRRVVHLATHGFFREDLASVVRRAKTEDWEPATHRHLSRWDPMLLAGLALAGANEREGGADDDGILTAEEASWLDLEGCDLVVLSACDTARGVAKGGEGVLGLVRGFDMAGARHVVASLWPVDDEATQLLMGRFYAEYLDDESPASPSEALRTASLWLRDEAVGRRGRKFDHPRYWAAFVAFGR